MIQKCKFSDGGFVLHDITLPNSNSRFSACYNAKGNLLGADRIDARQRCHKPGRLQLAQLDHLGSIWL